MGGFNSGWHRGGKSTTRGRNTLDVRKLARDKLLTPGASFSLQWTRNGQPNGSIRVRVNADGVNLIYRHGGNTGQDMDYPVMISHSACKLGGQRAWWLCPCCGKRVALLYSGKMFACRHCQRLTYQSTRDAPDTKAFSRADKIRARLGWHPGVAFPVGDRPKGMHEQTYNRWLLRYYDASNRALGASSAGLDKLMKRLGKIGL